MKGLKPKILRKLKVYGITVPVFKVPGLLKEGFLGFYSPEAKHIAVDDTLRGDELEATILHELFHAVLCRLYCNREMSAGFEEVIVENLSRSVIDNFQLRPRK